ncbi:MAG: cytochrome c [Chloroflexi bacterium]|nr:cytochrome c [Chloroflexota bacterium]
MSLQKLALYCGMPAAGTAVGILALLAFFLINGNLSSGGTHAYAAGDGQALFEQKCRACHSIGGGRLVGPDLKGIAAKRDNEWLVRFVVTPDRLIAQGDPIAKQLVQEYGMPMPNLSLSVDDARAILGYISAQSDASKPVPTVGQPPASAAVSAGDAGRGRDIFIGKTPLKHGGPSCLSCHNVSSVGVIGGGTVGKDLTSAYSLMAEAGLTSLLKTPPFPMMKEIYAVKPLTDDEIADLAAFLKEAAAAPATTAQNSSIFFIISAVGALLVIGMFQLWWRGRLSGVRRQLVKGGSK